MDRNKPGTGLKKGPVSGAPGWIRICISADTEACEAAGAFLLDLGCEGTVEENGIICGYLPGNPEMDELSIRLDSFTAELNRIFPSSTPASASLSPVAEENWAENWRAFFKPERVGAKLMIYPAWEPVPAGHTGHILLMDPGPAFGTGQHPTTRLCLKEIERLWGEAGRGSLLDVGTGSGILALYAAKLGFDPVLGIDVDAEALGWAAHNIALNGLQNEISLSNAPVQASGARHRVVVANILLGEILRILPHLLARTEEGGAIVISGILRDQAAEVEAHLPSDLAGSLVVHTEGQWACMTAEIQHSSR